MIFRCKFVGGKTYCLFNLLNTLFLPPPPFPLYSCVIYQILVDPLPVIVKCKLLFYSIIEQSLRSGKHKC